MVLCSQSPNHFLLTPCFSFTPLDPTKEKIQAFKKNNKKNVFEITYPLLHLLN